MPVAVARRVPLNTATMICGRNARTTVTTSRRIESFTQCVYVSSAVLENPKSYARVKNCRPPSTRRAASSSSVRIIPSSAPSSLPIRFCPRRRA